MKFSTAAAILAASFASSPCSNAFTTLPTQQRATLEIQNLARRKGYDASSSSTQQWMSTISDPSTTGKSVGAATGFFNGLTMQQRNIATIVIGLILFQVLISTIGGLFGAR